MARPEDAGFEELFRTEYATVVRTAFFLTGRGAVAEEVAQETFMRLYVAWSKVSRYERPGAWLRRVAIRLAMRAGRGHEELAVVEDPPETTPAVDLDVRRAIASLPDSQRVAIVLRYFQGLPVAEIGEALGCAESTAGVHLHRARSRLAELLTEGATDVTG